MSLTGIISVSGVSGLHKILTHMPNGLIVESLLDGRRRPIYATQKVSSLEDISIYTMEDDMPLREVFRLISDKESGKTGPDHKSDKAELRSYLDDLVPNIDHERVYDSDISKLFQWYNLLIEKDMMSLEDDDDAEGEEEKEKEEKKTTEKKASKPTTNKKTQSKKTSAAKPKTKAAPSKAKKAPSKAGRSSKKA